jgi:hypothetical protein
MSRLSNFHLHVFIADLEYCFFFSMSARIPEMIKRPKVESDGIGDEVQSLVRPSPPLVMVNRFAVTGKTYRSFADVHADVNALVTEFANSPNAANNTGTLAADGTHVDQRPKFLSMVLGMIGAQNCEEIESYGCTAGEGNAVVTLLGLAQNAVLGVRSKDQLTTRMSAFAKSIHLLTEDGEDHIIQAADIANNVTVVMNMSAFTNSVSSNASMVRVIAAAILENINAPCCPEFVDVLYMNMADTGLKQYDWICEHVARHPCVDNPSTSMRIRAELIQVGVMLKHGLSAIPEVNRPLFHFIYTKTSKRHYTPKAVAPICTRLAELCHGTNNPGFFSSKLTPSDEEVAQKCYAMGGH